MSFQPAAGDWVGVPWSVDIVEGVIVRTYDTGSGVCAVVSVMMPGEGDKPPSRTVTVPVSHLCPLSESRARHLRSAFRELKRDLVQPGVIKGVAELDLTGFTTTGSTGVWQNAAGVSLRVDFREVAPQPGAQQGQESLLHDTVVGLLASGAAPMEYWIEDSGGQRPLFVMYKRPVDGGQGWAYTAEYRFLRAACCLTIQLQAAEQANDSGLRESFVLHRLPGIRYVPAGIPVVNTPDGSRIVHDYVDSHAVDRMFPDHPLSRLRAALRQITPSIRLEEWFTALPAYPGSPDT